jgi:drug/metabolite transporter (DMT)-like permease
MNGERTGETLVFGTALLWALFPIITKLIYKNISILHAAGLSALFGAVFFLTIIIFCRKFSELKNKQAFKPMLLNTLLNGILFYSLIFTGLKYTTAGNAAILFLMEIFFTIIILRLWHKEKLQKQQLVGSFFMILGAFLVLIQNGFSFNAGDWIILIAMIIPPFGNYYAKQAREYISSSTVLFFRSLLSGIVLFTFASLTSPIPTMSDLNGALIFLIINGFILFGLTKLMWLEAIHRLLIGKAISLNAVNPIFTIILAFFILKEIPKAGQILGFVSVLIGIFFLTKHKRKLKFLNN